MGTQWRSNSLLSVRVSMIVFLLYDEDELKSFGADIISVIDDIFNQLDPSTVSVIEEVYGLQGGLCWKINLIWSACEFFK